MATSSGIGQSTKAQSFDEWDEVDRRAYMLFIGWRDYWVSTRGYCGEFRNKSLEEIRADPQFEKYRKAATWLNSKGRTVCTRITGWKLYLKFVCDDLISKGYRPSPSHLINDIQMERFNSGCGKALEHKPEVGLKELARRYRARLHPTIRGTDYIKLLGFDALN
jgi:hypothetical protein